MSKNIWQLQEAKNKFSNLVEKAQSDGPQIVTKRGEKTVVVLSFKEYKKISKQKTDLATFLQKSPLADAGLKISRDKSIPRDVKI